MTEEAFKELFNEYFDTVRNYIFYRSGDSELASDVTQEAFLIVWKKQLGGGQKKIKGLLFKIAGDILINHFRKQQTVFKFKNNYEIQQEERSPQEQTEFNELKANYEKALASLPENQRIVFLLSRNDGKKYTEIAEILELSVKTIEKRMSKALAYLKRNINR